MDTLEPNTVLTGTLHGFVAFDWGEEVDLDAARPLVHGESPGLVRRPRTPSSITYRPAPLRCPVAGVSLELPEIGLSEADAAATVFDFGAVSLSVRVPFRLSMVRLSRLAGALADPIFLVQAARAALAPLYDKLKPVVQKPGWREELSEEYIVFELPPAPALAPDPLLQKHAAWLAGLLLLESGPLSSEEIADATRLHVSYTPSDLFLADWAAGVLIDRNCEETLQIVEFSNLQLLEYRYLDNRLDDTLANAYRLVQPQRRSWNPLWRRYTKPRRQLGELKVDASELFDRTGNVLKLVGDQYLARAYRQLAERFHLQEWERSIHRKLETVEGVYKVLSDQAANARADLLELTIVLLIVFEIVMAFAGKR